MKPEDHEYKKPRFSKGDKVVAIVFGALALLCYLAQAWGIANFIVLLYAFILLEKFVFSKWIFTFQNKTWPAFKEWYTKWLIRARKHPGKTIAITFGFIILTVVMMAIRPPKVVFFPQAEPNFVYVYLTMPVGTDQAYTNTVLDKLESRVTKVLDIDYKTGKKNPIVKSVIANVTIGAVDPSSGEVGNFPNKGRVEVAFV
jgi:multidrug efflux pump subunit AcrB